MIKIKNINLLLFLLIISIILILLYRLFVVKKIETFNNYSNVVSSTPPNKIAFLFLTYNNLKRPDIWNEYFVNVDKNKYSIYLHAKEPEKVSNELLKGRQISKNIKTEWGTPSLVEANIIMMKEALKDETNKKFFIVSDSCCPITNFNTMYEDLMKDDKSILGIHNNNPNPERYDKIINPPFPKKEFVKHCGSGALLNRKHAQLLVDTINTLKNDWNDFNVPDEHYFGNMLLYLDKDFKINNNNYKLTFDTWQIDDLDNSQLKNDDIITSSYINLKSISNNAINLMRKANFKFIRKVNPDTDINIDYLLKKTN